MPTMPKYKIISLFLLLFVFFLFSTSEANAGISSCNVSSISPQNINGGEDSQIIFTILNNDENSNLLHYLKIKSQTSNVDFVSADGPSFGGFTVSEDKTEIEIYTTLSVGENGQFTISLTAGGGITESSSFSVFASDQSDGIGAVQCSGEASFSITSSSTNSLNLSDISVSAGDTQAVITWNTNYQTKSRVDYGTSTSYGSSVSESGFSTSHTLAIPSLSTQTTYYFAITSQDMSNNISQTSSKTFTTTKKGDDIVVTNTVNNEVVITKIFEDKTKPLVKYKTTFSKIYDVSPSIQITVEDNVGVSRVEYSVDDGASWYQLDFSKSIGKKRADLRFIPDMKEDGDYLLIIRATDTSGNIYETSTQKIIIDRLPPVSGAMVIKLGQLNIHLDSSNRMVLFPNFEYKFITTFSGGPNNVRFVCGDNNFEMYKSETENFWYASYKFSRIENCKAYLIAEDGAKNKTEKELYSISVDGLAKTNANTIKVYFFDEDLKRFVIWNGLVYGQKNPIYPEGSYSLILPKGKYYIESSISPLIKEYSNLIEVNDLSIVNSDWFLEKKFNIKNFFGINQHYLKLNNLDFGSWHSESSKINIKSKNTVLSFVTTWGEKTLSYLEEVQKLKDDGIEVLVVFVHEPKQMVDFYIKRSKFKFDYIADPDGEIVGDIVLDSYPTTAIVDNNGNVKVTKGGFVSSNEIKNKFYEIVY